MVRCLSFERRDTAGSATDFGAVVVAQGDEVEWLEICAEFRAG